MQRFASEIVEADFVSSLCVSPGHPAATRATAHMYLNLQSEHGTKDHPPQLICMGAGLGRRTLQLLVVGLLVVILLQVRCVVGPVTILCGASGHYFGTTPVTSGICDPSPARPNRKFLLIV